jgi:para-nitrobenzyl esterase
VTPKPVRIDSGFVSGLPARNRSVTVFRGIPYAAPPVGPLRWAPPQPPVPWDGVFAADRFGPMCPQVPDPETAGVGLPMSEDCLTVNVWTGATDPDERCPVLVWIYGGGFRSGAGASPRYDGENLARKGLVVVTFNYRLGALGFLATPELSAESVNQASGNYGLLDCVEVLRWVQRNIAAFGGDPDRVTIAGQSAGAGAVNFLAMSPLAKGLLHRAIAQSHARYSRDPELRYLSTSYRTLANAERAGADYARRRRALTPDALRALPWQQLIDDGDAVDADVETGSNAKPPLFRPVVDGWVLPHGYADTYAGGLQNNVAYIAGSNRDESGAVPPDAFAALRAADSRRWRPGMPSVHVTLEAYVAAARRKFGPLAEEFLRLYPAATDDEAAEMSSTSVRDNTRISTYLWGRDWSQHASQPVYTYFWTHRPPGPGGSRRAAHGSEIAFAFGNLDPAVNWSDEDRRAAEVVSGYWVNFAATGDPNGPALPFWPAYRATAPAVMELGCSYAPVPLAEPERFDFWQLFFETEQPW